MLAFPCSGCGANLTASEEMAGYPVRCPKCQATVTVPEVALDRSSPPLPNDGSAPAAPPSPLDTLRPCPFCGESIRVTATKCRFCKTFLKDGSSADERAGWDGDHLFVPIGGVIRPTHCGLCGSGEGVEPISKSFSFTPRAALVGLLLGPIPYAILATVLRKTQTFAFPLCRPCASRWTKATVIMWLFVLLGLVGFPALLGYVGSLIDKRDGLAFGILAGFLAWIAGVIVVKYCLVGRRQATCVGIDQAGTSLKLPHPEALRAAWHAEEA